MKSLFNSVRQLSSNTSLQNFFHLSLNQGVNIIVALTITPYLFQTLGEEQFGLVSVAISVILLFGMLVNYGFNLNIPQMLVLIKNDTSAKQTLINEVIFTRLFFSLILTVFLLMATQYLGLFQGYSLILAFSITQLFNDALYPMYILQGFDRLSWIAKANAISKLLYLGLVILMVNSEADAKWVNFLLGGTGLLVHGILLVYLYQAESIKLKWVAFSRIKFWLTNNFQFFFSTVASYIAINGGTVILKSFVDNTELGFYALAQKVAVLLRMIPGLVSQSIFQNATRLYAEDKTKFEAYLKINQRNGLIITFVICFLFCLFSKWVVRILAGEFIPLSANLMIILCSLPFIGMFNVSNMIRILVAQKKYVLSKATWITTIFMLIICSIGSFYYGSYGLAFSLVIVEIFNYVVHRVLLIGSGWKKGQ